MQDENILTFEQSLSVLEDIVRKMESPGLDLAESVLIFEKGMHLIEKCEMILKQAQQKVQVYQEKELLEEY